MPCAPIYDPACIARRFYEICDINLAEALNLFIAIMPGQIIRLCVAAGSVSCTEICFGDPRLIASLWRMLRHQVLRQRFGGLRHIPKLMGRIMAQCLFKRLLVLVIS